MPHSFCHARRAWFDATDAAWRQARASKLTLMSSCNTLDGGQADSQAASLICRDARLYVTSAGVCQNLRKAIAARLLSADLWTYLGRRYRRRNLRFRGIFASPQDAEEIGTIIPGRGVVPEMTRATPDSDTSAPYYSNVAAREPAGHTESPLRFSRRKRFVDGNRLRRPSSGKLGLNCANLSQTLALPQATNSI
jgi:hypothetical protein